MKQLTEMKNALDVLTDNIFEVDGNEYRLIRCDSGEGGFNAVTKYTGNIYVNDNGEWLDEQGIIIPEENFSPRICKKLTDYIIKNFEYYFSENVEVLPSGEIIKIMK